jgi:RNA recognition motif-containing protein
VNSDTIYVGGLPTHFDDEKLAEIFATFGPIKLDKFNLKLTDQTISPLGRPRLSDGSLGAMLG